MISIFETNLLTKYVCRCRQLGFECWKYKDEVTQQHTGQWTGRMKYGPTCARCRRAGRPCVPGPAVDEGLQQTAAALQQSNLRLQKRIESLKTQSQSAASASTTTTTTTTTSMNAESGAIISELQARIEALEEENACYEQMCKDNLFDLEVLREENEELRLDNEYLRRKMLDKEL